MGYAENVSAGQARKTNELLERQIEVTLETNRLLRLMLEQADVEVEPPPMGAPAGETAPLTGAQRFFRSF